jgi:transcriptional regulator with XRE-family HTH domain
MLVKGWNGQELADRASKFVPDTHRDRNTGKRYQLGRHLISSYARGANEPTEQNLNYIAKALGVKPEELLERAQSGEGSRNYATMTSSLDGRARLVIDAEVDAETALKVLALLRNDPMAKRKVD